jgi:hypothetical protein
MGYVMPDLSGKDLLIPATELVSNSYPLTLEEPPSQVQQSVVVASKGPSGTAATIATDESLASVDVAEAGDSNNTSERESLSLVRDTSGREHYIGPSGSLTFFAQLRRLLKSRQAASSSSHAASTSTFAQDDVAQALEANDHVNDLANVENLNYTAQPHDGHSPGSINSSIARDFTSLTALDINECVKQFPSEDVLELLVHSYFKNVHDDYPLFHRATFEDEYELYIGQVRHRSQVRRLQRVPQADWGWVGCLHMIIVFGSISNPKIPNVDHAALRLQSITVARNLLPQFISKSTLSNVRVLLLLALFLHNNNERNAAWNLIGTAIRISYALGLHKCDMSAALRPMERELRKRVFCTLYGFEQFLSSSLGRPSGLQDFDVELVPPREGFLDGGGNGPGFQLTTLSLRLQRILGRARSIHSRKQNTTVHNVQETSERAVAGILAELKRWKDEASKHQTFNLPAIRTNINDEPEAKSLEDLEVLLSWQSRSQLRAVLLLNMQYQYIIVLVTRSILLREVAAASGQDVENQRNDSVAMSTQSEVCLKHACQLASIVLLLDSFGLVNGLSGLDVFYAYSAAMVITLRLLRLPAPGTHMSDQEASFQLTLTELSARLQETLSRVEKCGTMRRLARVMETFLECAKNTQLLRNESVVTEMTPPTPYGISKGHPNWLPNSAHADSDVLPNLNIDLPPQLHPQYAPLLAYMQQSMTRRQPITGISNNNMPFEAWPAGALGAQAIHSNMYPALIDPYSAPDDATMLEWQDMESFLANYGPQ